MTHSESIKEIATALVKAQTALQNPSKNQDGYGYKYADLASIIDQVKPVLSQNGLSIIQLPEPIESGMIKITTVLMHTSGEFFSGTITMPVPDMKGVNVAQITGAAYTYARRYALSAILNISADEDTDGAVKAKPTKAATISQPVVSTPTDLVLNTSGIMCPGCHAPNGKYHTRGCLYANQ